jgi:hydroxyacyl-ACP dehydratase HTD2-like protein with hotdog domain
MNDHSEVRVGTALASQTFETSPTQVFRYSAATWNTHRIHYDKDYATQEGYPGVLVQSHLHGAFLTKYCTDWAGADAMLVELSLRVRRFAVAGESLTVEGTVREVRLAEAAPGRALVDLDLVEKRASDQETCVEGSASIDVPVAWIAQGALS